MHSPLRALVIATALAWLAPAPSHAVDPPDNGTVFLVSDCDLAGHDDPTTCFETLGALQNALWDEEDGFNPDAAHPVVVDIGPGKFEASTLSTILSCPDGGGWVTFRGAGRDRTQISIAGTPAFFYGGFTAENCQGLAFQDLSVVNGTNIAVLLLGANESTWTDVDIKGSFAAWYDQSCSGSGSAAPAGENFFWGVKFEAEANAFFTECARNWVFGSDLVARPVGSPTNNASHIIGVVVAHRAELHVFGSNVEVSTAAASSGVITKGTAVFVGKNANNPSAGYGQFEMQGGRIRVDSSSLTGVHAVGVDVDLESGGDASARVVDTATDLAAGSGGTVTRLAGDGTVAAPFLHPSGTASPATVSFTGQDLFVDTDCASSGCNSSGSEPHLLVYSTPCSTKWFDVVTGACKP
jgi:hypothetical protein